MNKSSLNNQTQLIDLTMSKSRYELEISNMQLECSAIFDYEEKSKLVYELYCKKLLFKCFAGWVNITMYESEDEENQESF
jgi:hypothetical protein